MPRHYIPKRIPARRAWSVAIQRDDGSEFLACTGTGMASAVFNERKYAAQHKRDLIADKFRCRVVPVLFAHPVMLPSK